MRGKLTLLDLPTYQTGDTGVVKCFIDVVMHIPGLVPKGQIKEPLLAKCSPSDLPEPFGIRNDPGQTKIDLGIIPPNDDRFCVCV